MKMKRIIALTLSIVLVATLTACGCSDKKAVKIGTGTITGQLNAAYATEEGDVLASKLIMPSLYSYDRNGTLLLDAAQGKTTSYQGTDYSYKSIANITKTEDKEAGTTTYTITLGDVNFSNGKAMTADDLIFTYYVLCDKSFDGVSKLKNSSIEGLLAYQYNNTKAPDVSITDDDIGSAMEDPSEELVQEVSDKIIRPVLEEGKTFCDENWQRYVERGYGNSSEEFFVMLFSNAIDSEYSADGKTYDQIFEDTVKLFGMNYKQISRIFYGEVEYLNEKALNVVTEFLFNKALENSGGTPVSTISGIVKKDDKTVTVTAKGTGEELDKAICDIPVLSKDYYGNEEYNYDSAKFGIARGDVSVVKSHSSDPLGYGPYVASKSVDEGAIYLEPNTKYSLGTVPSVNLKFIHVESDKRISSITEGTTDLTIIDLTSENLKNIENGGENLKTLETNGNEYEYFGFNLGTLIPRYQDDDGEDVDTVEEGRHLRTALGIIIASLREDAINSTIGSAGKIIEYPGSSSSIAAIPTTDSDYKTAFSTTSDGEKFDNAIEAAKAELVKAGYEFGTDGKIIYKDNLLTEFTIAIPSYSVNDACMMQLYDNLVAALSDLGFSMEPTYYDEMDEFVVALAAKSHHLWIGERSADIENISKYYHSDGEFNYYGIANDEIDGLLDDAAKDTTLMQKNYQEVYKKVMDAAIEVPIYQRQSAVVYNSSYVLINEGINITEFFGILNVPDALYYPGTKK